MANKNLNPRDPAALDSWVSGPGAAKIKWNTPGDLDRCVLYLSKSFPDNTKGICAGLKKKAQAKSADPAAKTPPGKTPPTKAPGKKTPPPFTKKAAPFGKK